MPAQDISNLNGVTFTEAERSPLGASTGYTAGASPGDGTFTASRHYTLSGPNTYTVTVLNSTYIPPTDNGTSKTTATFGEVEIVSHNGSKVVGTNYYLVAGFSTNGVLLGPHANSATGATPPTFTDATNYLQTGLFALGNVPATSASFPLSFGQTNTYVAPCYAEGTCILTTRGEVAVEALVEGDEAITASGRTRPVIWIGSRRVRPAAHPRPEQLNPVRVRRGAFGDNQPVRDLLLSPGHAVFMHGVLVPVGKLVNGATIVQDQVEAVRYFHVELDAHDILLAEGLACESYLDDGNRTAFANADQTADLDPRLDTQDFEHACAPVVRDGEALTRLRTALHARAQALGWRAAADPALEVVVDGVALPPLHQGAGRAWFHLPPAAAVTIRSRAGRPSEVLPEGQDPARHDPRRLGVALSELRLDGHPLDLADPAAFGPGFHALETHHHAQWRWTNGSAQLNLTLQAPAMLELTIRDAAPAWTRPAPRLVKAS